MREEIFKKGQSKRIWGELYKVRRHHTHINTHNMCYTRVMGSIEVIDASCD